MKKSLSILPLNRYRLALTRFRAAVARGDDDYALKCSREARALEDACLRLVGHPMPGNFPLTSDFANAHAAFLPGPQKWFATCFGFSSARN
jgi:hypothetical protein